MDRRRALKRITQAAVIATATPWLAGPAAARAQGVGDFPSRPIRIVVPYPPGGVTDVAARLVSDILNRRFGVAVVVENRPGASGLIGGQVVAGATPDGYTLLVNGLGGNVLPPVTVKGLPLDIVNAFVPIAEVAEFVNVLVVSQDAKIKTLDDLLASAKESPNSALSYGSNGLGTSAHLTSEFFAQRTGHTFLHVPYKGSGELLIDVVNGNLDFCFSNLPPVMPLIKKGAIRPLAVTSSYRTDQLPEVRTLGELGVADFDVTSWLGVYGPRGMDPAVIDLLGNAISEGVKAPENMARLKTAGFEPKPGNAAQFAALNQKELARWGKIARDANVSLQFGS